MRQMFTVLPLVGMLALIPPGPAGAAAHEDEEAIRKTVDTYIAAFEKGDVDGALAAWAPDADYTDATGQSYQGRDKIAALFKGALANLKGYKLNMKMDRFPNRPDIRPGGGGIGTDRFPNRPGDRFPNRPDNRPDWANRPNIDSGNRPVIGSGNININNNMANIANRPGYDRPWGYNRPWNRPYYNYHYGWHYGYWNNWARYPGLWFAAGATTSWLWGPGDTYVYSNPYYVAPTTTVVEPALDYSQPIAAPAPVQVAEQPTPADYAADGSAPEANEPPAEPQGEPVPPEVDEAFSAARTAFKAGDYAKALDQVNRAIQVLPGDATLHEFRALVLFAQGKYQEAAAAIYAVLAVGPGWNWETVRDLYPNTDTYTRQLRALEQYIREHSNSPDARFLLAYHYLVMGQMDPAKKELEQVVRLEPKDKLSEQLLKALKQGPTENAPTQS